MFRNVKILVKSVNSEVSTFRTFALLLIQLTIKRMSLMKVVTLFPLKQGLTLFALFTCSLLGAQASLSVQGVLKKFDGSAVDDGEYALKFTLWKSATGTAPADKAWEETIPNVETKGGVYNVVLGANGTPLDAPFDQIYYLGVRLGSGQELLPRPVLTHAPYALSLLGQTNLFPSTGPVKADNIVVPPGAPAAGVAGKGYSFGAGGDEDGGLFSTADGNVGIYVNGAVRFDFQSSPTLQNIVYGPLVASSLTVNGNETVNGNSTVTGVAQAQKFFAPLDGGYYWGNNPDQTVKLSLETYTVSIPAIPPVIPASTSYDTALVFKIRDKEFLRMNRGVNPILNVNSSFSSLTSDIIFLHTSSVYIDGLPSGNYGDMQWNSSDNRVYVDNSSRRFKYNIMPLEDDFSLILKAQPRTYTREDGSDRWEVGYIAEEMDSLGLKNLVDYDKDGLANGFNYRKMTLYITEVLKTQHSDIAQLRAENAAIKAENAALRTRQDALMQQMEVIAKRLEAMEARAGRNGSE